MIKKDFTTSEMLKMWKLVREELDKNEGNEFTRKEYEELLHKLECNLNHEMMKNNRRK